MKITALEAHLLTIDLSNTPIQMFGQGVTKWPMAIIEVKTDCGLSGLGEVYASLSTPQTCLGLVKDLADLLVGEDPCQVNALYHRMRSKTRFWAQGGLPLAVIGTIENALWDIAAQSLGVPLWQMLGGKRFECLPVYASGGLPYDPDVLRRELEGYLEQGFTAVKVRMWKSLREDIEKIRLCREVLGPDVRLMVDSVMGHNASPWSAKDALARAKAIEEFEITWYEDPVGNGDYEGFARVRDGTRIPVAAGESAVGMNDFMRFFDAAALDIVLPDTVHSGGIGFVREITAVARSRNVRVVLHNWGGAASILPNYHVAFADPLSEWLEFPTHGLPVIEEMLVEPLQLKDGCFSAPTAPGLGLKLEESVKEKHKFDETYIFRP